MEIYNHFFNRQIDKKRYCYIRVAIFQNHIPDELDLPNYATKSDFKITTSVETLKIAEKANLPSLKSDIDKLDIDKLEKVSGGLKSSKIKLVKLEVDELNLLILI